MTGSITKLTPHVPVKIEIHFPLRVDLRDFEAAVRGAGMPTEEVRGDTLKDLFLAWGWWVDIQPLTDSDLYASVHIRGIYGDWTWTEDDGKLFTALIPWTLISSHIVFSKARLNPPAYYFGITELDEYEVWLLDGTEIERKPVEQIYTFEW